MRRPDLEFLCNLIAQHEITEHVVGLLFLLYAGHRMRQNRNDGDLYIIDPDTLIWERQGRVSLQVTLGLMLKEIGELPVDDDTSPHLWDHLFEIASYTEQLAYLPRVQHTIDQISKTKIPVQTLDPYDHLVVFSDCVYDLCTGTTRPLSYSDYATFHIGYPFPRESNPKERQRIDNFLDEIFYTRETAAYALKLFSTCLHGGCRADDVWFCHRGDTDAIHAFLRVLSNTFGNYGASIHSPNAGLWPDHKRFVAVHDIGPTDRCPDWLRQVLGGRCKRALINMYPTHQANLGQPEKVCMHILNYRTIKVPLIPLDRGELMLILLETFRQYFVTEDQFIVKNALRHPSDTCPALQRVLSAHR